MTRIFRTDRDHAFEVSFGSLTTKAVEATRRSMSASPRKRTIEDRAGKSASCQKPTCDREQSQSRAINVGAWSLLWNKSPLHTVYKRRRTATARHGPSACRYCRNHGQSVRQLWRGMMKALFAALALVTLLASPTFAQTANSPTCGGYGWGPSSPCYGSNP